MASKARSSSRRALKILTDGGKTTATGNTISVTNADAVTLLIAAATSYKNYQDVSGDPEAPHRRAPEIIPPRGIESRRNRFAMKLPTDERIAHFADGNDPQLAALYFQFARYLLICSSRPGGQPATLQGLWNDSMTPPWDSKYTININTEMNYWPAEPGNLGECVEPLTHGRGPGRNRRAHGAGDVRRARLGGASQHRFVARDRAD
jgi:alpha-L-fucosidase 2